MFCVVCVVSSANAGDMRHSSVHGSGRSPEGEDLATHLSILAWRIPWTEGGATIHRVTKSQD